jgi:hypothetical protein
LLRLQECERAGSQFGRHLSDKAEGDHPVIAVATWGQAGRPIGADQTPEHPKSMPDLTQVIGMIAARSLTITKLHDLDVTNCAR